MKEHSLRPSRLAVSAAIVLLLCAVASLVILFERLSGFASQGSEFSHVIPLTGTALQLPGAAPLEETPEGILSETSDVLFLGETRTETDDSGETVYHSDIRAEIFRAAYENAEGLVTVENGGEAGERLIAPGTANRYVFTLRNTTSLPMDYRLEVDALVQGTEETLTLQVRVWDSEGKYLLGEKEQYAALEQLDHTHDEGVLGADRNAVYTLEWTWPFEQGGDERDTLLGNLAVGEEISLQIVIRTTAMADPSPEDPHIKHKGIPTTGDASTPAIPLALMGTGAALTGLVLLPSFVRRKKENAV